jgi:hypothetical protein
MTIGKIAYLDEITTMATMRSRDLGEEIDGSSPPSVFIGRANYPKVMAGPMLAVERGDTYEMDSPESWIPGGRSQNDIISYRLGLVRGKKKVKIDDMNDRLIETLQDISLSKCSVDSEVRFSKAPSGARFSEESTTYGPSGDLESIWIDNTKWDNSLEKAYHDTDLKAVDALFELHRNGVPFSSIQKAFSTGTMGIGRRRKLVPTRWSITAVDSSIGNQLLDRVKHHEIIDSVKVHEFSSLNNFYSVILFPSAWQYEWMEAFLKIRGNEEMLFADQEPLTGKKGYSSVGGCFYSCRMAVLEELARQKKQAGAIVLREAYRGYVPLGVFNVRENVRNAMLQRPLEFEDLEQALEHVSCKMQLPMRRYVSEGRLLHEVLHNRQSRLEDFT